MRRSRQKGTLVDKRHADTEGRQGLRVARLPALDRLGLHLVYELQGHPGLLCGDNSIQWDYNKTMQVKQRRKL